jgi:hypothetical protein
VFLFADIQRNQLATRGEGEAIPDSQAVELLNQSAGALLDLLIRRDILEKVRSGYRFQVELIRRWFLAVAVAPPEYCGRV